MKIPIVFAFDDNYAVPTSVAIMSLIATKAPSTEYEVIVFYKELCEDTIRKFERICPIRWVNASGLGFENSPMGWTGEAAWYRLAIANLLPEYDRVIWSDGDVLFKHDLADVFSQEIEGFDWMGVRMELSEERQGVHHHFPENDGHAIFASGFMVVNARRWRENNFLDKCRKVIGLFGDRLSMPDLDVLNLATNSIGEVSLRYCVLSNLVESKCVEEAKEYPWLSRAHGHAGIVDAVENPIIVHYAGCGSKLKPWDRGFSNIPDDYWQYLSQSPFYDRRYYFPRMSPIVLWAFDSLRYLASRRKGSGRVRTRVSHWEDMVRADNPRVYRVIQWLKTGFRKLRRR